MSLPVDVASQVSPELSALLSKLVNDPDEDETLLDEIQGLIERFGAAALAEGFMRYE